MMQLTLAQKVMALSATGLVSVAGFAYLATFPTQEVETEDVSKISTETGVSAPLGAPQRVGTPLSSQNPSAGRTSDLETSVEPVVPTESGSNQSQAGIDPVSQELSSEYNIPIDQSSFLPNNNLNLDRVIREVLANLDPNDSYNYDPCLNPDIDDLCEEEDGFEPYSSKDDVTDESLRDIEGLVLSDLETAFVEILNQLLTNLIENGYSLNTLADPEVLRDLVLGQIGRIDIPGVNLPQITEDLLGELDLTELSEAELEALGHLGIKYPELINQPSSFLASQLVPNWNAQTILDNLNLNVLTNQIGSQLLFQAPIADLLPCGQKIRRGSPNRYQEGIWSCSLCKRYCGERIGGDWIYYSYLYGNGKCGCDHR